MWTATVLFGSGKHGMSLNFAIRFVVICIAGGFPRSLSAGGQASLYRGEVLVVQADTDVVPRDLVQERKQNRESRSKSQIIQNRLPVLKKVKYCNCNILQP